MDDVSLIAKIGDDNIVYVCPVHDRTYHEYVEDNNLGGPSGYFIACEQNNQFEVLAKATSLTAARKIFGMIIAPYRHN